MRKNFQQRLDKREKEQASTVSCPPASSPAYWSRGSGVTKSSVELKLESVGVEEVWRDRETGPLFFLAERRVGSRLPMIGAASPDGANVLWKSELPSKNPMGAEEGEPEAFTMGRGRAIAGYLQKSEALRDQRVDARGRTATMGGLDTHGRPELARHPAQRSPRLREERHGAPRVRAGRRARTVEGRQVVRKIVATHAECALGTEPLAATSRTSRSPAKSGDRGSRDACRQSGCKEGVGDKPSKRHQPEGPWGWRSA